jgi:hypothetical protein
MNDVGRQSLQATPNLVPAHTWHANRLGTLAFVNERCTDYLGLSKDDPLGFDIDTDEALDSHIPLLHPDDQERRRAVWSSCLESGAPDR